MNPARVMKELDSWVLSMGKGSGYGTEIDGRGKARTARKKQPDPIREVIPIIFVPGIAGTILKIQSGLEDVVREELGIEKEGTLPAPWNPPTGLPSLFIQWSYWKDLPPRWRQVLLNPESTVVDTKGFLSDGVKGISRTPHHFASKSFKGWNSIHSLSYSGLLNYLEQIENDSNILYTRDSSKLTDNLHSNDPSYSFRVILESSRSYSKDLLNFYGIGFCSLQLETLKKVLRYCCPVYVVGYNWLKSNTESAEYLLNKIKNIKNIYNEAKSNSGDKIFHCEKVILVTHSMGGLVASAAIPMDTDNLIGGMVQIVNPAVGAPEAYRCLAGGVQLEVPEGHPLEMKENISSVMMGVTPEHTTPIMANSPGCLQLLPNADYPCKWLLAVSPTGENDLEKIFELPEKDPYEEIYLARNKWYCPVNPKQIDPALIHGKNPSSGWNHYMQNIYITQNFHTKLKMNRISIPVYACYGQDERYPAFGTIRWQLERPAKAMPLHRASVRTGKLAFFLMARRAIQYRRSDADGVELLYWRMMDKDSDGDKTVSWQSGLAVKNLINCRKVCRLKRVRHQTAGDSHAVQLFTLWSICKIIDEIK